MAIMWNLSGEYHVGVYGDNYLPRKFRYLKDAKEAGMNIAFNGGKRLVIGGSNGKIYDVIDSNTVKARRY